jgi:uncharacterized protein with NAD-binding domain and iron-sulfur cluster
MGQKVIILGGGVAGMSAAQELGERGFSVEVYEAGSDPGGKARSIPAKGEPGVRVAPSGRRMGPPLPGEHGFRFFPGFYRHVIDAMKRIPHEGGSVADHLVDTNQVHLARFGRPPVFYPARFPQTPTEVMGAIHFVLGLLTGELDIPAAETAFFAGKVFQIVSSCRARRLAEYEKISWWDFVDAANHSAGYQNFFANGFTRSLVAAKARRASTKTIGDIFLQMILSAIAPLQTADRVLDGPTSDVWINPWLEHLKSLGVRYHRNAHVQAITYKGGRIRSATVTENGRTVQVEGDYFVAAVPVERMAELTTPALEAAAPSLKNLSELSEYVEWMNGIQFYLTKDMRLVHGHSVYMDTPWALTSVSQAQFWPEFPLDRYADGRVRGSLSVCVSDWDIPGLNGKRAETCTLEEVKDEVWEELKRSLNGAGEEILTDDMLHSWFIDPSLSRPTPASALVNSAPLLVNYIDTWRLRPEAVTAIPNLFLASDYVRTYTDIATMEAANEAARRAANGVMDAAGSSAARCPVWNLHEPEIFEPLRAIDQARFDQGLPWDAAAVSLADGILSVMSQSAASLETVPGLGAIADEIKAGEPTLLAATGNGSAAPGALDDGGALEAIEQAAETVIRILPRGLVT